VKRSRTLHRSATFLFSILFIMLMAEPALANSEPRSWRGRFSAESAALTENCPVKVMSEHLTFDFTNRDSTGYAKRFTTTASYKMWNPTAEDITVEMVFPFESSEADLKWLNAEITVAGEPVEYELCRVGAGAQSSSPSDLETLDLDFGFGGDGYALLYTIDFPAGRLQNVTVRYEAATDMLTTFSQRTYSYTYLLSPASKWASFGKLDIELIPGENTPKLAAASPELTEEDGRYAAHLKALPDGELNFILAEDRTLLDILYGSALFFIVIPFVLALAAAAIIAVAVVTRRRKKQI
jgi:hypothetical protein